MRILALSGSLREQSYNSALARAAAELAPAGVDVEVFDGLGDLPLYDADLDVEGEEEDPAVRHLRERIAAADALFVVTPEYNGSISGVLKNAIDWASRPPGGGAVLWGKTAAVAGATTGQYGAIWAQQDLRRILGNRRSPRRSRASCRSHGPRTSSTRPASSATHSWQSGCERTSTHSSTRASSRSRPEKLRNGQGGRAAAPSILDTSVEVVEALPALPARGRCAARVASPLRWLGGSRWSRGHASTRWYLRCPNCHHSNRTTSFPRYAQHTHSWRMAVGREGTR